MTIQLWAILGVSVLAFIGVAVLDSRLQRAIRLIDEGSKLTEDVVNNNSTILQEFREEVFASLIDLCDVIETLQAEIRLINAQVFKSSSTAPRRRKIPTSR